MPGGTRKRKLSDVNWNFWLATIRPLGSVLRLREPCGLRRCRLPSRHRSGFMSPARPFAVHRFVRLTVRTPSFTPFPVSGALPFTYSMAVAPERSGSSVRVFHPRAEHFVAPRGPRIDDRANRLTRGSGLAGSSGLAPPVLRLAPPVRPPRPRVRPGFSPWRPGPDSWGSGVPESPHDGPRDPRPRPWSSGL